MSQLCLEGGVGVFLSRNGRKGIGEVSNIAQGLQCVLGQVFWQNVGQE